MSTWLFSASPTSAARTWPMRSATKFRNFSSPGVLSERICPRFFHVISFSLYWRNERWALPGTRWTPSSKALPSVSCACTAGREENRPPCQAASGLPASCTCWTTNTWASWLPQLLSSTPSSSVILRITRAACPSPFRGCRGSWLRVTRTSRITRTTSYRLRGCRWSCFGFCKTIHHQVSETGAFFTVQKSRQKWRSSRLWLVTNHNSLICS